MKGLVNYCALLVMTTLLSASVNATQQSYSLPFGTLIGQSNGTEGYNNCGYELLENEYNFIDLKGVEAPVFTGLKWQCVEYARRFLIQNKGITFDCVQYAFQIWDLKNFQDVYTNNSVSIVHNENKNSLNPPSPGDLLIYSNAKVITGHVAVIVRVGIDSVFIGEQNYDDGYWKKNDYSRKLSLQVDENGNYTIIDDDVIGWIHMNLTQNTSKINRI